MYICCPIRGLSAGGRETGASVVDSEFISNAAKSGHRVLVVIPYARHVNLDSMVNVSVYQTGAAFLRLGQQVIDFVETAYFLVKLARSNSEIVFRVNSFFSSLLVFLPILIFVRKPPKFFVQFHHRADSKLRNIIIGWILRRADFVVCPSEAARREVSEVVGSDYPHLITIYHGVDKRFFDLRDRNPVVRTDSRGVIKLLFVGHLERRKRPLFLLDLAKELHGKIPFHISIVGGGPEQHALRAGISGQAWSDHVAILGEIPNGEKLAAYWQADLFVFPSIQEGFGLVLCEAMAAGLPVLAFNTSAMPEIVLPGTGYLFDVDDARGMANSIIGLSQDRGLLEEMGAFAASHARSRFDWARQVRSICDRLDGPRETTGAVH